MSSQMTETMTELGDGTQAISQALTPTAKAQPRQIPLETPSEARPRLISLRDLQMLQSSLARAYFAANSGHSLLQQLAQQMDAEARVLSQAKDVVDRILSNMLLR